MVCQLDSLRNCLTRATLWKALKELPETLDETYDRILSSIPDAHQESTLRDLQWLCYSRDRMGLREMVEVLAIDLTDNPSFDPERRLEDPQSILIVCSSLVTITTLIRYKDGSVYRLAEGPDDSPPETIVNQELRLAHFSVQEYLFSDRIKAKSARRYHMDSSSAHASITLASVAYLFYIEDSKFPFIHSLRDFHDFFPLHDYAASFWNYHYRCITKENDRGLVDIHAYRLIERRPECIANLLRLYKSDPLDCGWDDLQTISPLYYTSYLGVTGAVRLLLLAKGTDVNAEEGNGRTALKVASACGNGDVVSLLLDHGANVNAGANTTGTALQEASDNGHEAVVRLLVNNGADVNAGGWQHQSASVEAPFRDSGQQHVS